VLSAFGVANSRLFAFGVPHESEFLGIPPHESEFLGNLTSRSGAVCERATIRSSFVRVNRRGPDAVHAHRTLPAPKPASWGFA
jgi:hypothetical protein